MRTFFGIDDEGIVHLVDYLCEEGDTYDGSNGYSCCPEGIGFRDAEIFHDFPGCHSVCQDCIDQLAKQIKCQEKHLAELKKLYKKATWEQENRFLLDVEGRPK